MTTKPWKQAGLVMAFIGAASLAQAQDTGTGGQGGDQGKREEMMKKYDADGDGQLSEAERAALHEEMQKRGGGKDQSGKREAMMKKFDTDGDGQLSETERAALREEMQKRGGGKDQGGKREAMMKKYDTDGDGQLSEAERNAMREERGGQGGKKGGTKGQGGEGERKNDSAI